MNLKSSVDRFKSGQSHETKPMPDDIESLGIDLLVAAIRQQYDESIVNKERR